DATQFVAVVDRAAVGGEVARRNLPGRLGHLIEGLKYGAGKNEALREHAQCQQADNGPGKPLPVGRHAAGRCKISAGSDGKRGSLRRATDAWAQGTAERRGDLFGWSTPAAAHA